MEVVQAVSNNGAYWSEFVNVLDMQYHESLYITDKYNAGSMFGSAPRRVLFIYLQFQFIHSDC